MTFQGQLDSYLKREQDIMSKHPHENIVKYLGMSVTAKTTFFVMELCTTDLNELIRLRKKLSYPEVAIIMWQILKALLHLHKNNVMHRYSRETPYSINNLLARSVPVCQSALMTLVHINIVLKHITLSSSKS